MSVQFIIVSPLSDHRSIMSRFIGEYNLASKKNERIETYDDAIRVVGWYEQRWIVEELPSTAGLF